MVQNYFDYGVYVDCYYVKSNCNKSCMSQGSEKSPAKNSESPMIHRNLLEKVVSEISWRRQCGPKNPKWNKQETWRHCSSGAIKIGIFDIYRSTLTRLNCLRILGIYLLL